MCPLFRGSTVHKEEDNLSIVDKMAGPVHKEEDNLWTKWLVPMCPLFRGSTVHKEEDNFSIVDKMAGPNVSFIQRFHCT